MNLRRSALERTAPHVLDMIEAARADAVINPPDSLGKAATALAHKARELYPNHDDPRWLYWATRDEAVDGLRAALETAAKAARKARRNSRPSIGIINAVDSSNF